MKVHWKIVLIIVLIALVYYCKQKLPYNLTIKRIDTYFYIYDKSGSPVIAEDYYFNYNIIEGIKVKKLIQYSKNDLGLVVMISDDKNEINYIAIKPKPEQNYIELQVDYTVYSEAEYKKLDKNDCWFKIK